MSVWDTLVTPTADIAAGYRAAGWWRDSTFLDDLAADVLARGDHPALIAYAATEHARILTYTELANTVERFASALRELGVRRGDVVALYLPNLWLLTPLYLACHRIGAVSSPVIPVMGTRELGRNLAATDAKVCVTVDAFNDIDCAARLAEAAGAHVRRVVVGAATPTDAIDFDEFFVRTPWEDRRPVPPADRLGPDEPAQMIYTSGTSGVMKAVVHSQNTLYAAVRTVSEPHRLTEDDVITVASLATGMAGMAYAVYMSLFLGATCVVQDRNTDMALLRDLIAAHRVTWLYSAPANLVNLLAAQENDPRDTTSLDKIVAGSAPVQPQVITHVRDVFGVPLYALWGMTENGAVTLTRPDDPDGWAAESDGRPMPWMEVRIDAEPGAEAGRLLVRGASQCLGYLGQRDTYEACLDADGWFDTGDLAKDDGRGGIRITGRRADLITRANGLKVATLDVEAVLQRHPGIIEVVMVGYPDPNVPGGDLVCAIVVHTWPPLTLKQVHEYLAAEGVAEWLWPDRIQYVSVIPRNPLGKILRQPLRERLEIASSRRR
ncbi:MAG TPA: AMP-binding protein [Pseudonocardiaceae bacterium]|jgi:cyclohexanecarboxylate-CoA ligase|nr:AMP-binding protein [Pseudonocardiaceae bacterium]